MSDIAKIMKKEMEKSNGHARMVKVPLERRPTADSMKKMQREVQAQLDANRAMRENSYKEK